jgi:elongator complex protein 3
MVELKQIYKEILNEAKKRKVHDLNKFNKIKLKVLKKYKTGNIPKNANIASIASKKDRKIFSGILSMKPTRTISGVAPIALMTDPYPCPHTIKGIGPCTYCPGGPGSPFGDVPQSYTGKEPSTRRAIRNHYDPYLGVFNRLEHYIAMNLVPEKVEVILQGGTFNFFPKSYQEYFIKYLVKAMNDFSLLFYEKKEINNKKFNLFFEMPADIHNNERTKRIQEKLYFIKNLDLSKKEVLKVVNNTLFNKKSSFNDNINLIKKIKNNNVKNLILEQLKKFNGTKNTVNNNKINNEKNKKTINNSDSNLIAIKRVINKVNDQDDNSLTLEKIQEQNETSQIRCVGLTVETKSDYGKLSQGNEMLRLGATRVEIGIQSIYNKVLEKTNRGNTVKDNIESIRILKDLGFKINAHYMPGMPYTTKEMDKKGLKALFDDEDYKPDMLKLYPCMVMKGTNLYEDYKKGKFKPLETKKAAELIAWFKQFVPNYCRIMRVQRDIPTFLTDAGVDKTNLRQYVEKELKKKNIVCNCIRCREIGHKLHDNKNLKLNKPKLLINEYKASKGKEFFISYEDIKTNTLFGFCRLRFPSQFLREEITKDSALIRELHVFGSAVSIGKKGNIQHTGIGKMLLKKAEEISLKNNKDKIVVISGIGTRNYYRKLGYKKEGPYMVKK